MYHFKQSLNGTWQFIGEFEVYNNTWVTKINLVKLFNKTLSQAYKYLIFNDLQMSGAQEKLFKSTEHCFSSIH